MKRTSLLPGVPLLVALVTLFCIASPEAIGGTARFIRYPDVHGDTIVFTWEGDLFSVPAGGGAARRLTTHPGVEDAATFSPDGKRIAFRGSYQSGGDVYVMPSTGGPPARVTWLGQGDRPLNSRRVSVGAAKGRLEPAEARRQLLGGGHRLPRSTRPVLPRS